MKKLIYIFSFLLIATPVLAANITVPTAPTSGYVLYSTASGAYTPTLYSSLSASSGGNIFGIGSSTPWSVLSIASSTFNYLTPLLTVSTSSDFFGQIFNIHATSSTLIMKSGASASNPNLQPENGARVSIGRPGYTGQAPGSFSVLDQLQVDGRINEGSWHSFKCYPWMTNYALLSTQTATDGSTACGDFSWEEDNVATLLMNAESGGRYGRLSFSAGAEDGSMLYTGYQVTPQLDIASTTPVMEAVARIGSPANASSSNFFIGFTDISPLSTTMHLGAGAGCFFNASTTQANWWATCSTGTATTTVNTGIASSTSVTATGDFYLFRLEISGTYARFYIGSTALTTRLVATVSSNLPTGSTQLLSPQLLVTRAQGATSPATLDFASVRLWIRALGVFGF